MEMQEWPEDGPPPRKYLDAVNQWLIKKRGSAKLTAQHNTGVNICLIALHDARLLKTRADAPTSEEVREAVEQFDQALLEIAHNRSNGKEWFTGGDAAREAHLSRWLKIAEASKQTLIRAATKPAVPKEVVEALEGCEIHLARLTKDDPKTSVDVKLLRRVEKALALIKGEK